MCIRDSYRAIHDVKEDEWYGEDITNLRADKLVSRGVGFVPQTENVFPSLTIAENLHMGAFQAPKLFNERFDYVCSIFPKLGQRKNQLAGQLSGGERQRVAIARAIVCDQPIILADEPTGSLDAVNRDRVMDILMDLCNEKGKTLIIVTHDTSVAERCDRIIRMKDGQITDRAGE